MSQCLGSREKEGLGSLSPPALRFLKGRHHVTIVLHALLLLIPGQDPASSQSPPSTAACLPSPKLAHPTPALPTSLVAVNVIRPLPGWHPLHAAGLPLQWGIIYGNG